MSSLIILTFVKIGENINVIKAINESGKSAKVIFNELNAATEKLTPTLTANYLANAKVGKEMAHNVLIAKGLRGAKFDQAIATYEATYATNAFGIAQKSASAITQFFTTAINQAKTSIKNFGTALKTNPLMLIATALTAVIAVAISKFQKYKQEQEEMLRKAQEAAETLESESKSIDDYAQKYQELRKALIDARGDEEKTYSLKQDMLALQEELNEKYGDEYGKLNLVTDAYNDQTEAIKSYKNALGEEYLNQNSSKIAEAKEEMEAEKSYELGLSLSDSSKSGKAIKKLIEKEYADQGIQLDEYGNGLYWIYIKADAQNAYDTINSFMTDIAKLKQKYGEDDSDIANVFKQSEESLAATKEILNTHKKMYDQARIYELRTDYGRNDNILSQGYEKAQEAVEAYNQAVLHSSSPYDDKAVLSAYDNLLKVKEEISSNPDVWEKYSSVIDDVFERADTRLVDFSQKIKDNEWALGDLIKTIKEAKLTDADLAAISDSYDPDNGVSGRSGTEIAFDTLAAKAKYYKISVEELISILTQLGVVQSDITNSQKKNHSTSEMIAEINALSEGFESLDKIMSSIKDKNPFDYTLLDDKNFKDNFSNLGEPYEKFVEQISSSPKDIVACQSAFDELTTAWVNSTGALDELSDGTAQLTIDMLTVMGVTNAQEVVASALARKHAEAAWATQDLSDSTYEEIDALAKESEATEASESSFKLYIAQKLLAEIAIDPTGDITALADIVDSLGIATSAWQQYYAAKDKMDQMNANKVQYADGSTYYKYVDKNGVNHFATQASYDQIQKDAEKAQKEFAEELERKAKNARVSYGGGNKANKSGGGGSKSSKPTELDAAAESVKNLKQQLDSLNTDLQNTDPYSEKLPILLNLIEKQKEYNDALQSQSDLYLDLYQQSLSALPQDLQDKISGFDNFSIETIPDSLKDAVSQARAYRDQWYSVSSLIKQGTKELENHQVKIMNLAQARLDDKIGVVQNKATDIQNQMGEAESMGLNATEGQYKSLIRLSRQEEKYQQNKLTGLQAELLLLDEDEDAYYDCLSAIQNCENSISQCAQNQAKWNKALLELPIQYLEDANDKLNDQLDELQDTQDDYDSAISGVTAHLQEQIDKQQELRDAAEEAAKKKIDAIQEEIDGLQKANDERKQQLDLEEKQYNLERAKNQKTNRVFRESEGGFVFEADQEAIRNAQDEYDDSLFNKHISDLQNSIKEIEDARDKLLESYDEEIDRLQKIMDTWDDITAAIQRAKDMAMAGEVLGSGWEDRVISGDTSDIENITGKYESNDKKQTWVQQQIDDNNRLIKKVEEYVKAWQMGEISIREAREEINDIVGDIMPEIEANDERVASISTYTSAWSNAKTDVESSVSSATAAAANNTAELDATELRRQAAFNYAQEWANSAISVGGALGQITESQSNATLAEQGFFGQRISNITSFKNTYSSMASSISSMCDSIVQSCKEAERAMKDLAEAEDNYGYARGTKHAKPGLHPVAEGNNPELIIKGNGAALLAKNETHYPFAGGETVLSPTDTKNVLSGKSLEPIDPSKLIFSTKQIEAFSGMIGKNNTNSSIYQMVQKANIPSSNISVGRGSKGDITITIGDVTLPQVKDVDTFAKAIVDGTMKSAFQQRLMKNK